MHTDGEEHDTVLEYINSLTLLCVEDDKTTRLLYESILEDIVGKLIFANDGEDGYKKFIENKIDIVLSDYDMPVLNGLGLIAKIKEINSDVPTILGTAVESIDVVVEALRLGVGNFLKKPIQANELLSILKKASKSLIASEYIEKQRIEKLNALEKKNSYNSYQEDLAFAKELNILRNDFYYQMIDNEHISLVDFLYQPLDVISGDAYTARRIDTHRTFYLIVDGMGKGLSASLTAMNMTSFINHIIDKMLEYDSFSLDILIKESMSYIKPILLDEEAVAIDYILFDTSYNKLEYAKFGMPALLMQNRENEVIKIKSNNPPMSKWQSNYNLDEYQISDIDKFLLYSDGIVENNTKNVNKLYGDYIQKDFLESFTREEFKNKFLSKIDEAEDDITLVFINRLPLENALTNEKQFETSLEDVENASKWYSKTISKIRNSNQILNEVDLVFTELYMNAYEHGNLGINCSTKHQLIEDDKYFDALQEKEAICSKIITVKVSTLHYEKLCYIITQISDEGDGFDTQMLSNIFRNQETFNGRGVFISRKNSLGIYYNRKGNSVLYLNRIDL